MTRIVLIATAWGPQHGGINSFNADFARALSEVLKSHVAVTCVVMSAPPEEVRTASEAGVRLLSLGAMGSEWIDESRALNVLDTVQRDNAGEVLWWVGHDVISGGAAVALPRLAGQGKSAVIHHMSYADYIGYKHESASTAVEKREQQRQIFRQADEVFAVGPLLRDKLPELLDRPKKVRMIVPGLAKIEPAPRPITFSAMTFGRLDPENDRIKQGRLAVAGFATACRKAHDRGTPEALMRNPRLTVIGAADEEKGLRVFAEQRAGRVINLFALPYENDRSRLFDELKRSSAAMMLSWHEGFGLTGWEAIAAGVPLILSRNSGLYDLIKEKLEAPGMACLLSVGVRGVHGEPGAGGSENFLDDDEEEVSEAVLELAGNAEIWKQRAKKLRTLLLMGSSGCTWQNAARGFAKALGILIRNVNPGPRRASAVMDPPPPSALAPAPPALMGDELTPTAWITYDEARARPPQRAEGKRESSLPSTTHKGRPDAGILLSQIWIRRIFDGLAPTAPRIIELRSLLLSGVPLGIAERMQVYSNPGDQLLADLNALNRRDLVGDMEPPLMTWLHNAMRLVSQELASGMLSRAVKALNGSLPRAELAYTTDSRIDTLLILYVPDSVVVGRSPQVDIVFSDDTVSSRHAEFRIESQGNHSQLTVHDLNSKNHTYVNDKPVSQASLWKGDRVQLASHGPTFHVLWGPVRGTHSDALGAALRKQG